MDNVSALDLGTHVSAVRIGKGQIVTSAGRLVRAIFSRERGEGSIGEKGRGTYIIQLQFRMF